MSKRINVMISDNLNERLDNYSERYGMSKSSIVGFVLGQWLDNIDRMNNAVYGATGQDGFIGQVISSIIENQEEK